MKRLAKYEWTDIAIRKEKKLLILVCNGPEQAKKLFEVLVGRHHYFTYKIGTDFFKVNLVVQSFGEATVSVNAAHPSFSDILDFDKYSFKLTTGALLTGGHLGYSKESLPLRNYYIFPNNNWYPEAFEPPPQPSFILGALNKVQRAFHSFLQRKPH